MKHIYKSLLILFLAAGVSGMQAQDIHFSQFYMNPLDLNPALTGVMNCNTRLVGNYRNQWAAVLKNAAYNTYSVSYDQKLPVGQYDYFGFGAQFWGDVAGSLDFGTMEAKVTGSYSKRMGGSRKESHYLVGGVELGVSQRSIDFLNAQWGNQHDGEGNWGGPGIDPFENYTRDNFLFSDIALGLLWFSVYGDNNNFYVGGAFSHLNQPDLTFYEDDNVVVPYFTKTTFHAGGEFTVNPRVSVVPGVVTFFQGPSFEVNGGASLRFLLGGYEDQSFQLGGWVRFANHWEDPTTFDAVILSTRFDYQQFGIGFSYDINVSSLREASAANGAFEFSLVYTVCGPERRGVYCPKF